MPIYRFFACATRPFVLGLALTAAALPLAAQDPQVREGTLDASDPVVDADAGRVGEQHTFEAETGQFVTVALRSGEFDAYLRVESPSGMRRENDDSGQGTDSEVSFVVDEAGVWTVTAAAYGEGQFGSYVLTWSVTAAGEAQTLQGRLSAMSPKGQPYDSLTVDLDAGRVILQVTPSFESYLTVSALGPDGRRRTAFTDLGGATLTVSGVPAGPWQLWVVGEEGAGVDDLAYTLTAITTEGGRAEEIEGTLSSGDTRLPLGEYADLHRIDVSDAGDITIEVSSDDFDTFLVVETAGEAPIVKRNDDADDGGIRTSSVTFTAAELQGRTGTWHVWVTSFSADQTGDYLLRIIR